MPITTTQVYHFLLVSVNGPLVTVAPTDELGNTFDVQAYDFPARSHADPTPCPIQFTDVPATNPFYLFVRCLACRGIVAGYADGTFRPGASVTRGQLAKILASAAGLTNAIPSTQRTFSDVPNSNAFWLFIERLAETGAISGYACGGVGEPCDPQNRPWFRWGANATRGQIAKITGVTAGWNDPIPTTQQTLPTCRRPMRSGPGSRPWQSGRLSAAMPAAVGGRATPKTGPTSAGATMPRAARCPRSPPTPSSPTARPCSSASFAF